MAQKLTAGDWIDAGLKALARGGAAALKAELLAAELKVSRGSFYWHFEDIAAFHTAVLARWREVAALAIIDDIERHVPPSERLPVLLRRAFSANAALERAMRNWGTMSSEVAEVLAKVDGERCAYVETLLKAAGVDPAAAPWRALLLYSVYLGLMLSGRSLSAAEKELFLAEISGVVAPKKGD